MAGVVPYFSLADEEFTTKLMEEATSDSDEDQDRRLMYNWVLWEQLQPNQKASAAEWKDLSRQVCTFGTVGEFWRYWRHVPQPSELLAETGGCRFVRESPDGSLRVVESMMLFREGVKPEWEDPLNAVGGHLQFSLAPSVGGKQIDEYWNNIVLAVIGSALPHPEMITGLRLCDKLYTKRGPPQGSVRIEVWFTNMGDEDKVDELSKAIQECITTRLDASLSLMDTNKDDDPSLQQQQQKASMDRLKYELDYLKRSISIAYPILEIIQPPTSSSSKEWLVLCNRSSSRDTSSSFSSSSITSWIPKALDASYNKGELFPTEDDVAQYGITNGFVSSIDDAMVDIRKSQEGSDGLVTTRRLELRDPRNKDNRDKDTTDADAAVYDILCLPVCTLLCVDEIVISVIIRVKYLIQEEVYPSLDNIKYVLHMAFSLPNITHNDILACARFGVEQGRLLIGKDNILPTNASTNATTISYTCYPPKYNSSAATSVDNNKLMVLVEGFYKEVKGRSTTCCYYGDDEYANPMHLALLIKMLLRYDDNNTIISNATLGELIWLFQRCISLNNDHHHQHNVDNNNILLSSYTSYYPLWSMNTNRQRVKVEIRNATVVDEGFNNTKVIDNNTKQIDKQQATTVGNTSPISPDVDGSMAIIGCNSSSSSQHNNNDNEVYDDAALAKEQLLFIHCFKNELLAGQGILLNQVNNLCKVRCGRSVKYREFRYGKLRDFLEDIKGLQVMGEKFQMTIRLTDVVEFDIFIRQANVRKTRGHSHTTLPATNNEKGGDYHISSSSSPPNKDDIGDNNNDEDDEAELKHISLPQLIPDNVIDKLRYMFACEHYQIEASVFVSLFKNRYFASDPMVYERLGYKRMRDFLGAVPQVHKHGTKSEAKYVWVENSAPLKLGRPQQQQQQEQQFSNIGNTQSSSAFCRCSAFNTSSSSSSTPPTAIDFIHSAIPSTNTLINNTTDIRSSSSSEALQLSDNIIDDILNEATTLSATGGGDDIVEIAIFDVIAGICTGASNGLERLFGFNLTGINFYKLIHPDDSVSVRMRIDEAIGIGHNSINLSTFRLRATMNRGGERGGRVTNNNSITVSGTASLLMGTLWTLSLVILD